MVLVVPVNHCVTNAALGHRLTKFLLWGFFDPGFTIEFLGFSWSVAQTRRCYKARKRP